MKTRGGKGKRGRGSKIPPQNRPTSSQPVRVESKTLNRRPRGLPSQYEFTPANRQAPLQDSEQEPIAQPPTGPTIRDYPPPTQLFQSGEGSPRGSGSTPFRASGSTQPRSGGSRRFNGKLTISLQRRFNGKPPISLQRRFNRKPPILHLGRRQILHLEPLYHITALKLKTHMRKKMKMRKLRLIMKGNQLSLKIRLLLSMSCFFSQDVRSLQRSSLPHLSLEPIGKLSRLGLGLILSNVCVYLLSRLGVYMVS
ncbi:hypothetical protein ARALYDRAFT_481446 [Arabidopsis lyrata subsp. lyrata]|uniref:Uncharacterized protein n=1 Tax=Arabidopsis lyrata subsp. lyrata TaxID=81972 RepID=D7LC14_ARALL|nr:hypothetical protein ARALYDRAFT_481446 [Arabidopsis lyrata subsp. lyrata]